MQESTRKGGYNKVNEYCAICEHYGDGEGLTDDEREELFADDEADGWCGFHSRPTNYGDTCYRFKDNPALS